jgi:competence ComEA-like helix-hairpin-helix protein
MEQKEVIKRISVKTGLTKSEIGVVLFLLITGSAGLLIKALQWEPEGVLSYNYSAIDSAFYSSTGIINYETNLMYTDKKVDYKQEVLDFNTPNLVQKKSSVQPAEKSINLNTAGVNELTLLPGIGEKTAASIIKLRSQRSRFKRVEELLDVKGIGEKKLAKIKPFLFIEK